MTGVPQRDGRPWRRLIEVYHALLSHLLVVSVAILVIPVSLQIFSRFTSLIPHYIWTEEMARFLFIWTIMIGAMIGVRERTHFEVDLLGRLRPKAEAVVRLIVAVAMMAFALVFVWSGVEFTRFAWNRISELAELPLWLIHIAWPITGVTAVLFIVEQAHDSLRVLFGKAS
ncbi:MAG: TRAP transporter small permease [Alphaproteobacteria bacterium]|nr:TRAP transporter small permease [Alphaproteobacteria bacterium]